MTRGEIITKWAAAYSIPVHNNEISALVGALEMHGYVKQAAAPLPVSYACAKINCNHNLNYQCRILCKCPDHSVYAAQDAPAPVAPAVDAVKALEGLQRYSFGGRPQDNVSDSDYVLYADVLRALQIKEG